MLKKISRIQKRLDRKRRVRGTISLGDATRPRVAIFRSLRYISAQAIDDANGITLAQAHSKEGKAKTLTVQAAQETGKLLAERLKKANVSEIVFDRGGYKYHGRVKALAEALREAGIIF